MHYFQLLNLLLIKYPMRVMLNSLVMFLITVGFFFKYCVFLVRGDAVKKVTQRIDHDYNTLENKDEAEIIEKRARSGRYYSRIFAVTLYQSSLLAIINQYSFLILDVVLPLNESRTPQYLVIVDVIDDEYWPLMQSYVTIGVIIITSTFVGTETIYLMLIQHASSLFEITTYRIKRALAEPFVDANDSEGRIPTHEMLIQAVDMHRKAKESWNDIKKIFVKPYIVLLLLGVLTVTINLYRLALAFPHDTREMMYSASYFVAEYGYIFYVNYITQDLVDVCNAIFHDTYDTKWYDASLATQKFVKFLLLSTSKNCVMDVCGIYNTSVQGFSEISKLCLSYFTSLCSIQ